MTIVWGTGHRPEDSDMSFLRVCELINNAIASWPDKIDVAICGMAAGFDLAWGMEALNNGIDVWSVRPWAGHKPRVEDARRYDWIQKMASRHIITNDSETYPGPWVYQRRNEVMVDLADEGIALWNGKTSGGTYNCLQYADSVDKKYTNIYPQ